MNKAYLLLGSNLNNPKENLLQALGFLSEKLGTITRLSSLYQTGAWGNTQQPDFINQVIVVNTIFPATQCIDIILAIEQDMGRVRTKKNAPRLIDIDILYFNKEIIDLPHLVVPHPAIQLRRFVLIPLNELSPGFVHPLLNQNNLELLKNCEDQLNVKKI